MPLFVKRDHADDSASPEVVIFYPPVPSLPALCEQLFGTKGFAFAASAVGSEAGCVRLLLTAGILAVLPVRS